MNKKLSKILSVVLAVLMLVSVIPLTATAAVYEGECGAEGDNLTWKIDESTATLYINGTGDMMDFGSHIGYYSAPWNQYYNRFLYVSIGDEVASIGKNAFSYSNLYVENIEIGKGIKKIGYNAFNLKEQTITVNADNHYMYIDENGYVLSKDNTILYAVLHNQSSIFIPDGVLEVRNFAFYNQTGNTEYQLHIPASVQIIALEKGFYEKQPAFYVDENNQYFSSDECGALFNKDKTIIYRGSVAARNAYPCYKIPETVTEIADYAFYNAVDEWDAVNSQIEITKNVKRIGSSAFCNIDASTVLFIPLTVEYVDANFAAIYADYWVDVYYEGTQAQWEQIFPGIDESFGHYSLSVHYEHSTHVLKENVSGCETVTSCLGCGFISEIKSEHNWEFYDQQAASCVDGYTEYRCDNCWSYKTETILATGEHAWECGDGAYDCGETVYYYCRYCDEQKNETLEHSWYVEGGRDPDCADGEIHYCCEVCGKYKIEIVPAVREHNWEIVGTDEDDFSCENGGTIYYYCSGCGSEKTEILPATSEHDWEVTEQTDATCTNDGFVYYNCSRCGSPNIETIPATGEHSWSYSSDESTNATCGKDGQNYYTCDNCSVTKTETIPATGNHDWFTDDTADCVSDREINYYCYDCTASKTETIPAIGSHDWEVDSQEDATCANDGAIHYSCTNCSDTKTETIPATGNHDIYWVYNNDATCTQDGTKTSYCNTCNSDGFETVTAEGTLLGHNYDSWVALSEVSCSQDGIKVCTCKNCSDIQVDNTKAYGHFDNDNNGKCDDCLCLLEYTGAPDTPDVPDTPDTPDTPVLSGISGIFATLFDLLNQIIEFFKNLFGIM